MGLPEITAHHFMAKEDTESREHVGQAIIRHFGETASRNESLDLTAINASNLHGNVRERRHLGEKHDGLIERRKGRCDPGRSDANNFDARHYAVRALERRARRLGSAAKEGRIHCRRRSQEWGPSRDYPPGGF